MDVMNPMSVARAGNLGATASGQAASQGGPFGIGSELLSALAEILGNIVDKLNRDGGDSQRGGSGDDTLEGGDGDDRIDGRGGDDSIDGGPGNDRLRGGRGDDVLRGMAGRDRLNGGAGNDVLRGGRDDDRLSGGRGDDNLRGGSGNDRLNGGGGVDTADYAPRTVAVEGDLRAGRSTLDVGFDLEAEGLAFEDQGGSGLSTDDILDALIEGDGYVNVHSQSFPAGEIRGQLELVSEDDGIYRFEAMLDGEQEVPEPADTLASGTAKLIVDSNNDSYDFSLDADNLDPGELNFLSPEINSPVHVHIAPAGENGPIALNPGNPDLGGEVSAETETDRLRGIENITGTAFDDTLSGDRRSNRLEGGDGNDILRGRGGRDQLAGGAGDDTIRGGRGRDVLEGGAGDDILRGGRGVDRFVLGVAGQGVDTIEDFRSGRDSLDAGGRDLVYDRESGQLFVRSDDDTNIVIAELGQGTALSGDDIDNGSLTMAGND